LAHASEEVEKTRMMAYAMLRPPLPSDAERRRDLLMARSPSELLEVLQASSPDPPCSGKQIADALVENTELRRDNDALTRRMHSALADSARLNQEFATLVRERDAWKKSSDKQSLLVSSFRKEVVRLECLMRETTQRINRRVDESQVVIDDLR